MREIKFRAFHKKEGILIKIKNLLSFAIDGDIWINENKQHPINTFCGWVSEDFELMQYTGLKDKNKEPIYEGDIVKIINGYTNGTEYFDLVEKVEFKDGSFLLGNDCFRGIAEDFEVIGNIYENPELLEESKD